jgi:peptide methionine sulfoxide reductase msrA/msrB
MMEEVRGMKKWGMIVFFLLITASAVALSAKDVPSDKEDQREVGIMDKVEKTDEQWKKELSPEAYNVLRKKGTERPFSGEYVKNKEKGIYKCAACGAELFSSETKFESGTGWPSFWAPIAPKNMGYEHDDSFLMERTEVHCPVCGGHLGHVFDDGPAPTGKRFCINSVSLKFATESEAKKDAKATANTALETATFAAGCFWGVEETFRSLKGVKSTAVGYTGGHKEKPTYKEVCADTTGHAEAVQVQFDPKVTPYEELLKLFWTSHNPTTVNRQGPDHGSQYRSAVFFHTPEQEAAAKKMRAELERSGKWKSPIVTEIAPASTFWKAEDYHQQYLAKQGKKFCHL